MTIFIINRHKETTLGGSEIQCDIIGKYLSRLGHKVFYLAYSPLSHIPKEDYEYVVLPFDLKTKTLESYIDLYKPDIIYWRLNRKGILKNFLVARTKQVKFVFAISSRSDVFLPGFDWRLFMNKPLLTLKNYVYNRRDFSLSTFKKMNGLVSLNSDLLMKLPIKKQVFIPNSMELDTTDFTWERPYCVWVANIKRQKNPELFLKLANELSDLNVDFLMIGAVQERQYKQQFSVGRLLPNLYYLGPKSVEYVNSVLLKSLFLVHTCDPEGFGNIFIQAWNYGKPTVSLYFDPMGYIESEGLGMYCRTYENLKEAAKLLVNNPQLRDEMGSRAKEFSKKFVPEVNVRLLETFLKDIVSQ